MFDVAAPYGCHTVNVCKPHPATTFCRSFHMPGAPFNVQSKQPNFYDLDLSALQVPVGVVNVGIRCASPAIAEALEVPEGAPVAMISNMAVAPGFRRQGLARQLVSSCCEAALRELKPRPQQLMLLVYKDYEPARR